jgi:hypothetical protein
MWDQFGPGAVGIGWDMAMMGLDRHFVSGAALKPEGAAAWLMSPSGKDFVRQSSEAWGAASIAAGTDSQKARAGAERVTALYLGEVEGPVKG